MSTLTSAPTEIDFFAAFGVDPVEARPHDGYWCYTFDGDNGVTLRFSFCTHDTSVQTCLLVQGRVISVISGEAASCIQILGDGRTAGIKVSFEPASTRTTLLIEVFPQLQVTWGSVRLFS